MRKCGQMYAAVTQ